MTRLILSLATAAALLAVLWLPSLADAQPTDAPTPVVESPAADAPAVPDPTIDLGGWTAAVLDAIRGGRWLVTFGLLLVGLVALARWGLARMVPWFGTDRGGTVLAAVTAAIAVVGSGLGAGAPFGLDLFAAALAAAAGAIGIFTAAKRLIAPKDQRASPAS